MDEILLLSHGQRHHRIRGHRANSYFLQLNSDQVANKYSSTGAMPIEQLRIWLRRQPISTLRAFHLSTDG